MNEHNITNTSLALSMLLVVVAMLISHKESWRWKRYSVERMPGGDTAHYCRLCTEIHLWR